VFKSILSRLASSGQTLKFLIYNGDADLVCNFLADHWFMERLAAESRMQRVGDRVGWNFTQPSSDPSRSNPVRLGGFSQVYRYGQQPLATFTAATVKGAGHMVPYDRPGPALQLMYNWINGIDLSTSLPSSLIQTPQPLPSPTPAPAAPPKSAQDKVWNLPGLTFTPNFGQHAGYVPGAVKGNYLFYWLMEPQHDFASAPVLLWLQGGPGCASSGGLFLENGPFRVNPDGRTLYENVYAWNKGAFMIFLDSPRSVGFSYQVSYTV
jgi:cathepsin A (carboxypeptidase C)